MINSFKNYLKLGKVKRKTSDPEEAKALLIKALERLEYIKIKEINTKTAKFILEDAYESMREAAQSLMSRKGFKPYSHEATISFIQEFHSENFEKEEIYRFDHFRKLRHDSIYKAVIIEEIDARSSLIFAKRFVAKIQKLPP